MVGRHANVSVILFVVHCEAQQKKKREATPRKDLLTSKRHRRPRIRMTPANDIDSFLAGDFGSSENRALHLAW